MDTNMEATPDCHPHIDTNQPAMYNLHAQLHFPTTILSPTKKPKTKQMPDVGLETLSLERMYQEM